ncbi:hypothetical protein IV203_016582 [Nitzschia inconspicua]|uniref:Uncharacterized protein n=1 Tax=Nitzschia inconspicua TaxID=303405 RepID=A0A9K3PHI3_9STRA|nr:hypothetical protein IV203_006337 [Nitzschia inconspicua]KAG7347877.1 hypothetical protein IV203_016582 [Nitzschia inconspicua]
MICAQGFSSVAPLRKTPGILDALTCHLGVKFWREHHLDLNSLAITCRILLRIRRIELLHFLHSVASSVFFRNYTFALLKGPSWRVTSQGAFSFSVVTL